MYNVSIYLTNVVRLLCADTDKQFSTGEIGNGLIKCGKEGEKLAKIISFFVFIT